MAITNAFIVYREAKRQNVVQTADHAEFLEVLHDQLLQVTAADLVNENGEERPPPLVGIGYHMRPLGKKRSHSLERDEEEKKNEEEEEEYDKGPGVVQGRQTAVI
ncbi:hypothetical protein PInf_022162 [Phytophthora infestans]|nr:hypothetical protein PInf_022162 [Phytophthora infestans]